MGKQKQPQENTILDEYLQNKKKKRREDDGLKAMDQSKEPEYYSKKKKKRKHSHSNAEEILESPKSDTGQTQSDNCDMQRDGDECSVRKKPKKRKEHSTDKVITESERNKEITEKCIVNRTDHEAQSPVKRKKKKKRDKAERLSECENTTVIKGKEIGQDETSPQISDELEEIRRQERKQKKKNKKLKKLEQNVKSTISESSEAGPNAFQLALDYLSQWEKDRVHWRFQKVRQVWLLHNMYDENKVNVLCSHIKVIVDFLKLGDRPCHIHVNK